MCVSPEGFCLLDSYMFAHHIRVGFQHINPCQGMLYVSFMPDGLDPPTGKHPLFKGMRR
jgi:hypothetical protein